MVCCIFRHITDAANVQVAWLSIVAVRNVPKENLKYKRHNNVFEGHNNSSKVRVIITQYYSAKQTKLSATELFGDC
jgi:hypothetical protein